MNQVAPLDPNLHKLSSPNKILSHPTYPESSQAYSPIQPSPNTSSYQNVQTPSYYGSSRPEVHDSPEETSPDGATLKDEDAKRPRACEACRQLKVKCEIDDNSPHGICKRCLKASRQCIITQPSRKRQKKTDSRVAELEKKIDALTASLHTARAGGDPDRAHSAHYPAPFPISDSRWPHPAPLLVHAQSPPNPAQIAGSKRSAAESFGPFGCELPKLQANGDSKSLQVAPTSTSQIRHRPQSAEPVRDNRDLIERGLVDRETAYKCFERYQKFMCPHLPVVVFPADTKADEVLKTKPILFQAIVGVAINTIQPDLQSKLINDSTKIIAEKVIGNGEKSLELVQTIQIMTIFYQPPDKYEELNFNQFTHMAVVMALDIGLGKRSKKGMPPVWKGFMDKNRMLVDYDGIEVRRCWLGCYYMCSNSAMSLRRPLLLRWSLYADECLERLNSGSDALSSDRWLAQLVQAQRISESISTEFAMDDPVKELKIVDESVQRTLRTLEAQLEAWVEAGKEFMSNPIARHTQAIISLYMHEIAMHNEHNIDDFRPPYHSTPIEGPPDPESVTPIHIASLTTCLQAAQAAFDAFLDMDIDLLRALPTHFFVRNSYAAVALIKLYTAIAGKGSKIGAIIQPSELRVEHYLDRLITVLTKVAEGGMSKVAYKFSLIFQMLRTWHLKRTEAGSSGQLTRENSQPRIQLRPMTSAKTERGQPLPHSVSAMSHQPVQRIFDPHTSTQPPMQMLPQQHPPMWQQPSHPSHVMPNGHRNSLQDQTRTPLQMLSDVAMQPQPHMATGLPGPHTQWHTTPHTHSHHPHSSPPMQHNMPQIGHPHPSQQQLVHDPSLTVPITVDPNLAATYGMTPVLDGGIGMGMGLMDFTTDELMAYGFGDEFMAMNFGWDVGSGQGGGAAGGGMGWMI